MTEGKKRCHRGLGDGVEEAKLIEPEPTDAAPGSEEKIMVLQKRLLRGEKLHSASDYKLNHKPGGLE